MRARLIRQLDFSEHRRNGCLICNTALELLRMCKLQDNDITALCDTTSLRCYSRHDITIASEVTPKERSQAASLLFRPRLLLRVVSIVSLLRSHRPADPNHGCRTHNSRSKQHTHSCRTHGHTVGISSSSRVSAPQPHRANQPSVHLLTPFHPSCVFTGRQARTDSTMVATAHDLELRELDGTLTGTCTCAPTPVH